MKKIAIVFAVLLAISSSLVARQENMGMGGGSMPRMSGMQGMQGMQGMMGGMMGRLGGVMADLKLTDDQKKDLDKMKFETMKQVIAQGAKAATMHVELQELLHAEKPNQAAIEKKVDELTGQASSIGKLMVGQWFAVNKMLTPDQQKVWKRVLEMRPMMNRRMRGMGGMGMMRERMMQREGAEEKEKGEKK